MIKDELCIYHILYYDFLEILGVNRHLIILTTLVITMMISYYMFFKYTKLNHSSIIAIMTTIAEEVLTELSSTTEQSGEESVQWVIHGLSYLFYDKLPRSAVVLSNLVIIRCIK